MCCCSYVTGGARHPHLPFNTLSIQYFNPSSIPLSFLFPYFPIYLFPYFPISLFTYSPICSSYFHTFTYIPIFSLYFHTFPYFFLSLPTYLPYILSLLIFIYLFSPLPPPTYIAQQSPPPAPASVSPPADPSGI